MITVPVWYWPILSGLLGYCGLVLVSNPSTPSIPSLLEKRDTAAISIPGGGAHYRCEET